MATNGGKVAYGGVDVYRHLGGAWSTSYTGRLNRVCGGGGLPSGTHCTEAGWASEPIWTLWRTKKSFPWALELS